VRCAFALLLAQSGVEVVVDNGGGGGGVSGGCWLVPCYSIPFRLTYLLTYYVTLFCY
jgi:hypothetical protein